MREWQPRYTIVCMHVALCSMTVKLACYFGEFARQIGRRLEADSSFVGIMANGASGDVNNISLLKPRPAAASFGRVREVANRIADIAYEADKSAPVRNHVALAMVERTLELP